MDASTLRLNELVTHVRESLDIEVKDWLDLATREDQANLAQALIALANHGGGYVVIGFREIEGVYGAIGPARPIGQYCQDTINNIVDRYAAPRFHCDVHFVADEDGVGHPVIVVPGGHRVPIRAARGGPDGHHLTANAYYVRRHGPRSEPPQSPDEWDNLIRRCLRNAKDDLLDGMRAILVGLPPSSTELGVREDLLDAWIDNAMYEWTNTLNRYGLPDDHVARFPLGHVTFAYRLVGNLREIGLARLRDILGRAEGNMTGWPEWMINAGFGVLPPGPINQDVIACSLAQKESQLTDDCDYWQVSRTGFAFLLRGHQEDGLSNYRPAEVLDVVIPIWRVGEAVIHAAKVAAELMEGPAEVQFRAVWSGLANRRLVRVGGSFPPFSRHSVSHIDEIVSDLTFPASAVQDTLPELVGKLTEPLYGAFGFYELPPQVLLQEIEKMRR